MTNRRAQQPAADVFARTVPLIVERHYFGEHKKASLANVDIRKNAPDEAEADKRLLALTKRLINSPETAALRQRDTQFREWLRTVATPFRPGFWLVPVGLAERVHAEAQKWEEERNVLADAAAEAYPRHKEAMRQQLGPLYNPLDYPNRERYRAEFWVDWRFVDFGVPNLLREISAEVFEHEREKVQRQAAKAVELVEQHAAGMLLEVTDHLAYLLQPRAGGKLPALREGALDRMMQFLDTAALRDVTDFKGLQRATARLRQLTKGLTVEQLREDKDLRARVAAQVAEAKELVEGLVTEETRRGIRLRATEEVA